MTRPEAGFDGADGHANYETPMTQPTDRVGDGVICVYRSDRVREYLTAVADQKPTHIVYTTAHAAAMVAVVEAVEAIGDAVGSDEDWFVAALVESKKHAYLAAKGKGS